MLPEMEVVSVMSFSVALLSVWLLCVLEILSDSRIEAEEVSGSDVVVSLCVDSALPSSSSSSSS